MNPTILSACLAGLLLSCSSTLPAEALADRDAAIVKVATRMLQKGIFRNATEVPICLGTEFKTSPSQRVLAALGAVDARVTRCGPKFVNPVYVVIREVAFVSEARFRIGAGYYCGPLCADHTVFTVRKVGDSWEITEELFEWIS